jgi:hypothetical protein
LWEPEPLSQAPVLNTTLNCSPTVKGNDRVFYWLKREPVVLSVLMHVLLNALA